MANVTEARQLNQWVEFASCAAIDRPAHVVTEYNVILPQSQCCCRSQNTPLFPQRLKPTALPPPHHLQWHTCREQSSNTFLHGARLYLSEAKGYWGKVAKLISDSDIVALIGQAGCSKPQWYRAMCIVAKACGKSLSLKMVKGRLDSDNEASSGGCIAGSSIKQKLMDQSSF